MRAANALLTGDHSPPPPEALLEHDDEASTTIFNRIGALN
jgi:hypothetical protein